MATTRRAHEWDASGYDRTAAPMTERGGDLVDGLRLAGSERVLDAGCGTGQVTARLLDRLPGGGVVALDGSRAMLDRARHRLAGRGRVEFVHADLTLPLPVWPPVDAVVSTSTFHWVTDHAALFRHLAGVMRPGAALAAEFGGAGNCDAMMAAMAACGETWFPWRFAGAEETAALLRDAGFRDVEVRLDPRPVRLPDRAALRDYMASVALSAHLPRLPEDGREAYVDAVTDAVPGLEIDFVRLRVAARRA